MTTSNETRPVLLIVSKKGNVIAKCDHTCYADEGFACDCICGGANHGVGFRDAAQNAIDGIQIAWHRTKTKIPKSQCTIILPRGLITQVSQRTLFDLSTPYE